MANIDGYEKQNRYAANGQDLNSKSNQSIIQVREYLVKTCDLKDNFQD